MISANEFSGMSKTDAVTIVDHRFIELKLKAGMTQPTIPNQGRDAVSAKMPAKKPTNARLSGSQYWRIAAHDADGNLLMSRQVGG